MQIKEAKKFDGSELTKMERYALTSDPAIKTAQDIVGQKLRVKAWAIYEDNANDGSVAEVLSITDGAVTIGTISATFRREFEKCAEVADGAEFEIEVFSGTAKSGRDFVSCRLIWVDE